MIFSSKEKITEYVESGIWGTKSLERLFLHHAKEKPDSIALGDPYNKAEFLKMPYQKITYEQLQNKVDRLAAFFIKLGLKKDDIICLSLPNIVENYISILAAWRAGLIVLPLSPVWRNHEINSVFSIVQPSAVITTARMNAHPYANMMRYIAKENFSIRFVFGFASPLPDGVINLDCIIDDKNENDDIDNVIFPNNNANDIAVITLAITEEEVPTPIARSHNHLLAAGISCFVETGVKYNNNILSCYSPNSLSTFTTSIIPWLLSGGKLIANQPFNESLIAKQIVEEDIHFLSLPAGMVHILDRLPQNSVHGVWAVWTRMSQKAYEMSPHKTLHTIIDIYCLSEYAVMAVKRQGFNPKPLSLESHFPSWSDNKNDILQFSLKHSVQSYNKNEGYTYQLACKGAQVPEFSFNMSPPRISSSYSKTWPKYKQYRFDDKGYIDTGFECKIYEIEGKRYIQSYDYSLDVIFHGNIPLSAIELDKVYSDYYLIEKAALLEIEDENLGAKIIAAVVVKDIDKFDLQDFLKYLHDCRIAKYKIVEEIYIVEHIPLDGKNKVNRKALKNYILHGVDTPYRAKKITTQVS